MQTRAVEEKDDGMRLDRWFLQHFPNLKFGHLQKLLRSGQIRVDGGRVKSGTRLKAGQTLRIPPLDSLAANPIRKNVKTAEYKLSDDDRSLLDTFILYEDDDVIAVNKPSGLASQGGSRQNRHLDGIMAADAREKGIDRPHLVHRLDLETSGVCLIAKNAGIARKLGEAFRGHQLQKYYWAVCLGVPEDSEGQITAPIAKQNVRGGEAMEVDPEFGKSARTVYAVADRLGNSAAWVLFSPLTGRTHQIRVHAAYMGCPLIGDTKYASMEESERFEDVIQEPDPILHLHARRLVIPKHVLGTRALDITAPLSDHMRRTCKKFGFIADAALENTLLS